MRKPKTTLEKITRAFDPKRLKRVCEMDETAFGKAYAMDVKIEVDQPEPANYFYFKDNGSDILAVAHLDTVGLAHERRCQIIDTEGGPVVFSRALDDRLGAYIILELLPALGINHDVLLTVGEEQGMSTAQFFEPWKDYTWMIEFDRGGTDVVLYDYEDDDMIERVRASGAVVGDGIFSDISYMEHLGIKGINWGVGYRDYHGPRSHAFLDDTFMLVAQYLRFHTANQGVYLPHEPSEQAPWWGRSNLWGNDDAYAEYAHGKDESMWAADSTWNQ